MKTVRSVANMNKLNNWLRKYLDFKASHLVLSGHMKAMVWCWLLLALIYTQQLLAFSSQEVLLQADESRGNVEGISWEVTIESLSKKRSKTTTFKVKARGFDILAETIKPPKNKGDKLLMVKGNMWFHKPNLSKPVPISRRQKLLGEAAYGDIAATNYANDYQAKRADDEVINGEQCYLFLLTSINKSNAYDKIKYWISKKRLVGVRAEYMTVSGKIFKSALMEYNNNIEISGKIRPFLSKITIIDELVSDDYTTLDLNNPVVTTIPNYIFDLNMLRR